MKQCGCTKKIWLTSKNHRCRLCIPDTIQCPRKYLNIRCCYNRCRWCALIRATWRWQKNVSSALSWRNWKWKSISGQTGKYNKDLWVAGWRHASLSQAVPVRTSDIWHFKTAQQKQLEPLWPFVSHKSMTACTVGPSGGHSVLPMLAPLLRVDLLTFVCVMCTLTSSHLDEPGPGSRIWMPLHVSFNAPPINPNCCRTITSLRMGAESRLWGVPFSGGGRGPTRPHPLCVEQATCPYRSRQIIQPIWIQEAANLKSSYKSISKWTDPSGIFIIWFMPDKNVQSPVLVQLIHHEDREPALSAEQPWRFLQILSAVKQQTSNLLNILVTSRHTKGRNLKHPCKGLKIEAKEKHHECIIWLHLRLNFLPYIH